MPVVSGDSLAGLWTYNGLFTMSGDAVAAIPTTCAICDKPLEPGAAAESPLYPFCSRRCKLIDLMRWCDGRYAVVNDMDPDAFLEMGEEFPEGVRDGE